VHDVSELTRDEAVTLVTGGEAAPCLRLFRRPDGRVMTRDCMTRRERAWKWLHRRSTWAAALFALLFLMGCGDNTCVTTQGKPAKAIPQNGNPPNEGAMARRTDEKAKTGELIRPDHAGRR
jgi:hypothetical protein